MTVKAFYYIVIPIFSGRYGAGPPQIFKIFTRKNGPRRDGTDTRDHIERVMRTLKSIRKGAGTGALKTLSIESAGITDVGKRRKENEDTLLVDDGLGLYIVADGMGGHRAGEVASRLVVALNRSSNF